MEQTFVEKTEPLKIAFPTITDIVQGLLITAVTFFISLKILAMLKVDEDYQVVVLGLMTLFLGSYSMFLAVKSYKTPLLEDLEEEVLQENEDLQNKVTVLESMLDEQQDKIKTLLIANKEMEMNTIGLKDLEKRVDGSLGVFKNYNEILEKNVDKFKARVLELEAENQKLILEKGKFAGSEDKIIGLEKAIKGLTEDKQGLERSLKGSEDKIIGFEKAIKVLTEDKKVLTDKVKVLESENKAIQEAYTISKGLVDEFEAAKLDFTSFRNALISEKYEYVGFVNTLAYLITRQNFGTSDNELFADLKKTWQSISTSLGALTKKQ